MVVKSLDIRQQRTVIPVIKETNDCPSLLLWGGFSGGGSAVKNPPANAGHPGSIPGSGRSLGEGTGNPLQYSCLWNSMDRGAWWATVHWIARKSDMTYGPKQKQHTPPRRQLPVCLREGVCVVKNSAGSNADPWGVSGRLQAHNWNGQRNACRATKDTVKNWKHSVTQIRNYHWSFV